MRELETRLDSSWRRRRNGRDRGEGPGAGKTWLKRILAGNPRFLPSNIGFAANFPVNSEINELMVTEVSEEVECQSFFFGGGWMDRT